VRRFTPGGVPSASRSLWEVLSSDPGAQETRYIKAPKGRGWDAEHTGIELFGEIAPPVVIVAQLE
jgi:hypothetical protein